MIDIKWISQLGFYASWGKGDCGMAATAMILDYHGITTTVDELSIKAGYPKDYLITNSEDMIRVSRLYGVDLFWKRHLTLDFIDNELEAGRPVIALVWYPFLTKKYDFNYTDNHFIVLLAKEGDEYVYHDPYWPEGNPQGRYAKISIPNFSRSWRHIRSNYGSYNAVLSTTDSILPEPPSIPEPDEPSAELELNLLKSIYADTVHVRWNVEQSVRDLESGQSDLAKSRLLALVDRDSGKAWLLENYFGNLIKDVQESEGEE